MHLTRISFPRLVRLSTADSQLHSSCQCPIFPGTALIIHKHFWVLLTSLLFFLSPFQAMGQHKIGFTLPKGVNRVDVPFEEYSNLIVIPITINNYVTLKFILDTGAESAILTEKLFADILNLHYVRTISMRGPGLIDSLHAQVATGIQMSLPGGINADGLNMLVLTEDYLELTKNLGEEIYGIIGYDLFHRFVINIDYDRHVLHIFRPDKFKPRRWDKKIPIVINGPKPYVTMNIIQNQKKEDTVKLMIDTGASHSLLLDVRHMDDVSLPDKLISTRLGQGLGGEIPGFMGRLTQCTISEFIFEDLLVSIPIEGAYIKAIKRGSRHGTLGGDLLTRFNVTFDYPNNMLYLRKGSRFQKPFEFNMSGLTVTAEGDQLDSMQIDKIRPNTPGEKAGLQEGDYILKINGKNLKNNSLSDIHMLLRRRDGMKIRMIILRKEKKMKKTFHLKRLI